MKTLSDIGPISGVTWIVSSVESNSFGDQIVEFTESTLTPTARYFKIQRSEGDWMQVSKGDLVRFADYGVGGAK